MTSECSLLEQTLAANLSWNAARIKFLSRFLLALFTARTVNLTRVAVLFAGRAKIESNYKRIKRFLAFFELDAAEMTRLLVKLMNLPPPFVLSIDRTEWRLGKKWINVLMLSVVWEGVAIPIVWTVFKKKGCSSDAERQAIIEKYLQIFAPESIAFVTADREFASAKWLKYLSDKRINARAANKSLGVHYRQARQTDAGKQIAAKYAAWCKTDLSSSAQNVRHRSFDSGSQESRRRQCDCHLIVRGGGQGVEPLLFAVAN